MFGAIADASSAKHARADLAQDVRGHPLPLGVRQCGVALPVARLEAELRRRDEAEHAVVTCTAESWTIYGGGCSVFWRSVP